MAALEGADKAGSAAKGRRIQVNVGTEKRPRLIDLIRHGDLAMKRNPEIFDVSEYEPSERSIDRSLQNVKKQGLTLVAEQKKGKTMIIVVPRRFLSIIRDCREVADKTEMSD